jgi:hypothetical protein
MFRAASWSSGGLTVWLFQGHSDRLPRVGDARPGVLAIALARASSVSRSPLADGGGTATARNSRNTKLAELRFRAVVGDGTRKLRFERLLTW